jgi:YidC/Oxa1 family membrane protein insertase
MINLYHTLIADPLLNILVGLYESIAFKDMGIAIIVLTVLVRLAFYPLFQKGLEQQAKIQKMQPLIKELQAKHKSDPAAHSQALLKLYKEHKFNPFASIGMLLIQIPILLALYHLFINIFKPEVLERIYTFVPNPGVINQIAFGLLNLKEPLLILVLLTAVFQFIQARLAMAHTKIEDPAQRITSNVMLFAAPLITVLIFSNLPAAVVLYWLITTILSILQQYFVQRRINAATTA